MPMRISIELEDKLLRGAKRKAAEENRPLEDILNEALRLGLEPSKGRRRPRLKFRLKTVVGKLIRGVDLTDRHKLLDLMESCRSDD